MTAKPKSFADILEEHPEPPASQTLSRHIEVFSNEDKGREKANHFAERLKELDFTKLRAGVLITVQDIPGDEENSGQMQTMTFGPAHITLAMAANLAHIAMQLQQAEETGAYPENVNVDHDNRH